MEGVVQRDFDIKSRTPVIPEEITGESQLILQEIFKRDPTFTPQSIMLERSVHGEYAKYVLVVNLLEMKPHLNVITTKAEMLAQMRLLGEQKDYLKEFIKHRLSVEGFAVCSSFFHKIKIVLHQVLVNDDFENRLGQLEKKFMDLYFHINSKG
jgi:hypothetical protein